jgi:hypothetical protein
VFSFRFPKVDAIIQISLRPEDVEDKSAMLGMAVLVLFK